VPVAARSVSICSARFPTARASLARYLHPVAFYKRSISHSSVDMGQDALEGTILVDSHFPKRYLQVWAVSHRELCYPRLSVCASFFASRFWLWLLCCGPHSRSRGIYNRPAGDIIASCRVKQPWNRRTSLRSNRLDATPRTLHL
jgi:hypothetical protein